MVSENLDATGVARTVSENLDATGVARTESENLDATGVAPVNLWIYPWHKMVSTHSLKKLANFASPKHETPNLN